MLDMPVMCEVQSGLTDEVVSKHPIKEFPICVGQNELCKVESFNNSKTLKQGSISYKIDNINTNESHDNSNHGIFCVTGKDIDCIDIDDLF